MASMSGAFRSHLMQQFASAARGQSRPPLALLGWGSSSRAASLPADMSRHGSDNDEPASRRPSSAPLSSLREGASPSSSVVARQHRHASCLAVEPIIDRPMFLEKPSQDLDDHSEDASSSLATSMQSLIQTRRTISVFDPNPINIKEALGRAVACGFNAPNHHKTQAFSFKRLISPSEATDRLADIAYHVKLRKKPDCENNRRLADRKREKWSQIPGFLVTLVEGHPDQEPTHGDSAVEIDPHEPLPFVGPETEEQLEDYAAACAAVQNVLLSLHSEGIGAKWATGPVTRTTAFRSLIGAQRDERVVGLVMVGYPRRIPRAPRKARPVEELFQDL